MTICIAGSCALLVHPLDTAKQGNFRKSAKKLLKILQDVDMEDVIGVRQARLVIAQIGICN